MGVSRSSRIECWPLASIVFMSPLLAQIWSSRQLTEHGAVFHESWRQDDYVAEIEGNNT